MARVRRDVHAIEQPLSAVELETDAHLSYTVEALAATSGVAVQSKPPVKASKGIDVRASRLAYDVARAAGIDSSALRQSAFRFLAINTGATKSPTLVASFLDPESSDRNGSTAHVLALGDDTGGGYQPTFRHTASGVVGA